MATGADTPLDGGPRQARTDRQSAGESRVAEPPRSGADADRPLDRSHPPSARLRIAALEARVATLEATVEQKERERQHVVDRYETLLRDARRDEQPDRATEGDGRADETAVQRALGRVADLF